MDHIGIDVHKKDSQICILAEGGELMERRNVVRRFSTTLRDLDTKMGVDEELATRSRDELRTQGFYAEVEKAKDSDRTFLLTFRFTFFVDRIVIHCGIIHQENPSLGVQDIHGHFGFDFKQEQWIPRPRRKVSALH